MGPKIKAICDSGPIIHLQEIRAEKALSLFSVTVPPAVMEEVHKIPAKILVQTGFNNDLVQFLQNEFSLGLAESQCIALAKACNISVFLTDDLDARTTAKQLGLEPHGTIGILLKAFKKRIFSKKQTMEFIKKLKTQSTLYITSDLVEYIIQQIENKS